MHWFWRAVRSALLALSILLAIAAVVMACISPRSQSFTLDLRKDVILSVSGGAIDVFHYSQVLGPPTLMSYQEWMGFGCGHGPIPLRVDSPDDPLPVVPFNRMDIVAFPCWALAVVLFIWPAAAFIRGPYRRFRRRKSGCCLRCGYLLKGLTEPRCPECGERI